MLWSLVAIGVGLAVLVVSADRLVVAAVRLSRTLGVSAVLIGAVVVGLGTSLPELVVSVLAARAGELDVAMANVVGSNVANASLVLGAAALFAPLLAGRQILRREGALMAGAVVALAAVLVGGFVSRLESIALLVGMVAALTLLIVWSRRGSFPHPAQVEGPGPARELLVGLLSLVGTVAGAQLLLTGTLDLGDQLGWSATFLGLLLGVGTSLPELATALAAARRHEPDLVIGNVLGSNLFNSLTVAGTAGLISPGPLLDLGAVPVLVMVLTAFVAGAFARTGRRIVRGEGLVLIIAFIAFTVAVF